jgi:hypothetical protein
VIDLTRCGDRIVRRSSTGRVKFDRSGRPRVVPFQGLQQVETRDGALRAEVRSSGKGRTARQTIWIVNPGTHKSHPAFSETQYYKTVGPGDTPGPIMLLGMSDDYGWVFFTIDPGGSASIAADGLMLRAVSTARGRAVRIARMLPYPDYLTWCGNRLVFTSGVDRVATNRKRLMAASPPNWRPRPLVAAPRRSWGSVTCAPGQDWLVAQAQRQSSNPSFFSTHWSLWRVDRDGSARRLTSPPRGYADESPRVSRTGNSLLFVRSHNGSGKLYALREARLAGPLLSFGNSIGYYGHHDWWQTAAWSAAS